MASSFGKSGVFMETKNSNVGTFSASVSAASELIVDRLGAKTGYKVSRYPIKECIIFLKGEERKSFKQLNIETEYI